MVVSGDPSQPIADIENVELVFGDALGLGPRKLTAAVKGRYGLY